MDSRSPNPLDRSPTHLLHRASQSVDAAFAVWSKNLTPRQLAVLITIDQHEGGNQTELVNRTGIDRSTLSDVVARLKHKGLIQRRRPSHDARAYAVKLTDEGRHVLRAVTPIAVGVDRSVLGALPKDRREAFLMALASIVRKLERAANSAV